MRNRICLEKDTVIRSRMDSYMILRPLSEAGGFSLTYYAIRNSDQQLTVIKELYPRELAHWLERNDKQEIVLGGSERQLKRWNQYVELFLQEGKHGRQIQYAAARMIVDADSAELAPDYAFFSSDPFEDKGTWYIAVCTGRGETVCGSGLGLSGVLSRMIAVCTAVQGLHRAGWAHCDIKPDNLFVLPSGQVKLLDFGTMQDCEDKNRNVRCYSAGFSAPELLSEGGMSGVKADVYSVAAVFFYMLFEATVDEVEDFSNGIPELQAMTGDEFPKKLYGHSFSTIDAVFALLRGNLSGDPQDRAVDIDALRRDFVDLVELCRRDEEDRIFASEEIVRRLCEIYALQDAFPLNSLPQDQYVERQKPLITRALEPNRAFKACIDSVRRLLYIEGQYEKSLFCLLFLEENTEMSRWINSDRRILYEFLVDCCDKLGQEQLRTGYLQRAKEISLSRADRWNHQFEETLRISTEYEHRMDFANMLHNESEFVQTVWGDGGETAAEAICAQTNIDRYLANHAGKLGEALCLCRPSGWQRDARAILTHIANHLSDDNTFRDRSIDNLLHFSIEIGDAELFAKALRMLSPVHPMHYSKEETISEWVKVSAQRFGKQRDAYALYLFLKSVNRLFFESIDEECADILCGMLMQLEQDDLNVLHPHSLIYAHSAIMAARMAERGRRMEPMYQTFREKLEETIEQSGAGIVRLIAEAACLAVCRCAGDIMMSEKTHERLVRDIRQGISRGLFSDVYFSTVLDKGIEELLSKFRFKHA